MEQIWETGEIIMIKLKDVLNEKKDITKNNKIISNNVLEQFIILIL